MTEIWIHRKCAREGDELVLPKVYKDTTCAFCGETVDKVFLHEGEEFNETAAKLAEVLIVAESVPSVKLIDEEGTEMTVDEVLEKVEEATEEEIVEAVEEEIIEEAVEAEPEPSTALDDLDAQIAELKAKKDALEE